ncbi:hypothetical protein [Caldithrix abyssi]
MRLHRPYKNVDWRLSRQAGIQNIRAATIQPINNRTYKRKLVWKKL